MLIKERFASTLELQRDNIICPDGGKTGIFVKFQGSFEFTTLDYMYVIAGEVSLDWANDEISKNLPNDAPILGILHTITGSARQNVGFMRYAASRGWRSCVLNRRGHSGMPLRVPYFSIMGNVDDTVLLVNQMRQRYPDNFIGLAGISAGSGQVVSYIGRESSNVSVNVAASLCPAWDISSAFQHLQQRHPWVDRYVTRGIVNHFLR